MLAFLFDVADSPHTSPIGSLKVRSVLEWPLYPVFKVGSRTSSQGVVLCSGLLKCLPCTPVFIFPFLHPFLILDFLPRSTLKQPGWAPRSTAQEVTLHWDWQGLAHAMGGVRIGVQVEA